MAARNYHAYAICYCSYLLYICYLMLFVSSMRMLSAVVVSTVCMLPSTARIYRIRAICMLFVSIVCVLFAAACIYHAYVAFCSLYLPYTCCLLQLVSTVCVLSVAARIYHICAISVCV